MNTDQLLVVLIVVLLITGWLPTYIIMQRKLIAERSAHKHDLINRFNATFEAGVIAGRDEERRDAFNAKLARRRANFPNNV